MAYREYSPEELRQMQLEAAQRVREMQRQARERLEGSQQAYSSQSASPAPSRPAASYTRDEQPTRQHTSSPAPDYYQQPSQPATRHRMPSNDLWAVRADGNRWGQADNPAADIAAVLSGTVFTGTDGSSVLADGRLSTEKD